MLMIEDQVPDLYPPQILSESVDSQDKGVNGVDSLSWVSTPSLDSSSVKRGLLEVPKVVDEGISSSCSASSYAMVVSRSNILCRILRNHNGTTLSSQGLSGHGEGHIPSCDL